MQHNGKARNFTLPVYDKLPNPNEAELIILRNNPELQDGIYIFMEPSWRWIKSEVGDQYDFPVTENKFSGRRSSSFVANSLKWVPIAITVEDFKDVIYSHVVASPDVVISKRSRFTVECEFSASRSSGKDVQFGLRLLQRPANGNACTLVQNWQPNVVYPNAGERVQYGGVLYENNWYSVGQRPDQNSGPYSVWTNLGECVNGPATFQPIMGSYSYNTCANTNSPSAFVRSRAELSFDPGGAVRAEICLLTEGSITVTPETFRFNVVEG